MAENNEKFWNDHINHLMKVGQSIPAHKVTILTGGNGKGKSFLRKVLGQMLEEQFGGDRPTIAETSLETRAGIDASLGCGQMFYRDMNHDPSSMNTWNWVEGLLQSAKGRFLVIDEVELGMGEELQMGLCLSINELLQQALDNNLGILVITHSRVIVKNLKHDNFINLEGMTEEEWVNREIVPITPAEVYENSRQLYRAIDKRLVKRER